VWVVGREREGEGLTIIRNKVGTRDDKSDGGKTHPDRLSFFSFFSDPLRSFTKKIRSLCSVLYLCWTSKSPSAISIHKSRPGINSLRKSPPLTKLETFLLFLFCRFEKSFGHVRRLSSHSPYKPPNNNN
jgi:hypothetical protein